MKAEAGSTVALFDKDKNKIGEATADENGKATVAVTADGLNVVGVEVAFPTQNKGEQNKYFSALSFLISPEE